MRVLRPGFRVDGERPARSTRPPTPSEHRDALLAEIGYDAAACRALVDAGAVR